MQLNCLCLKWFKIDELKYFKSSTNEHFNLQLRLKKKFLRSNAPRFPCVVNLWNEFWEFFQEFLFAVVELCWSLIDIQQCEIRPWNYNLTFSRDAG